LDRDFLRPNWLFQSCPTSKQHDWSVSTPPPHTVKSLSLDVWPRFDIVHPSRQYFLFNMKLRSEEYILYTKWTCRLGLVLLLVWIQYKPDFILNGTGTCA
jgi:hypothetical protein